MCYRLIWVISYIIMEYLEFSFEDNYWSRPVYLMAWRVMFLVNEVNRLFIIQ